MDQVCGSGYFVEWTGVSVRGSDPSINDVFIDARSSGPCTQRVVAGIRCAALPEHYSKLGRSNVT